MSRASSDPRSPLRRRVPPCPRGHVPTCAPTGSPVRSGAAA
ncbi:hypothetical protein [Nannocystis pusilla]